MKHWGWILLGVLLVVSPEAIAQSEAEPSIADLSGAEREQLGRLIGEAREAFEREDFVAAIDRLQRAYRLYPDADIFYRIGQAYEGLKNYPSAIEAYQSYLRERPEADDREIVDARIENLTRLVEANTVKTTGILVIESDPAGAEVWLDSRSGFPIAKAPVEVEVEVGEHRLHLSAEGHEDVSRTVDVTGGERSRVVVALTQVAQPVPQESSVGPWVLVGLGTASLLAAVTTSAVAFDARGTVLEADEAREDAYSDGLPIPDRPQDYDTAVKRERTMWTAATITGGVGLALVGSAIGWWLFDGGSDAMSWTINASPTNVGARIRW